MSLTTPTIQQQARILYTNAVPVNLNVFPVFTLIPVTSVINPDGFTALPKESGNIIQNASNNIEVTKNGLYGFQALVQANASTSQIIPANAPTGSYILDLITNQGGADDRNRSTFVTTTGEHYFTINLLKNSTLKVEMSAFNLSVVAAAQIEIIATRLADYEQLR